MAFKSAPCFICHNTFDFNTDKGEPAHAVCPSCSNSIRPQLAKKQNLIDKATTATTATETAPND